MHQGFKRFLRLRRLGCALPSQLPQMQLCNCLHGGSPRVLHSSQVQQTHGHSPKVPRELRHLQFLQMLHNLRQGLQLQRFAVPGQQAYQPGPGLEGQRQTQLYLQAQREVPQHSLQRTHQHQPDQKQHLLQPALSLRLRQLRGLHQNCPDHLCLARFLHG